MSKANDSMQSMLPGLADTGLDTTGFRAVAYEKLFNTGNYTNVRIGAAVDIMPGESAAAALERARLWVEAQAPAVSK